MGESGSQSEGNPDWSLVMMSGESIHLKMSDIINYLQIFQIVRFYEPLPYDYTRLDVRSHLQDDCIEEVIFLQQVVLNPSKRRNVLAE